MEKVAVKVGSISYALKGKDLLLKGGFRVYMTRDLNPNKGEGCGYSLCIEGNPTEAYKLLKKNGIRIYGVSKSAIDFL